MDWGELPGLVVMGGDSCYECREFEFSTIWVLDGHF